MLPSAGQSAELQRRHGTGRRAEPTPGVPLAPALALSLCLTEKSCCHDSPSRFQKARKADPLVMGKREEEAAKCAADFSRKPVLKPPTAPWLWAGSLSHLQASPP